MPMQNSRRLLTALLLLLLVPQDSRVQHLQVLLLLLLTAPPAPLSGSVLHVLSRAVSWWSICSATGCGRNRSQVRPHRIAVYMHAGDMRSASGPILRQIGGGGQGPREGGWSA